MKTLIGFFILLIPHLLSAQFCGFDHSKDDALQDVRILRRQGEIERKVREWTNAHRGGDMEIYTIPVVVHVIHQNGGENLPDEQIENAIELLNNSFANLDLYYDPDGINIPIRFCLSHVDPDGNFHSGINRVESGLTTLSIPSQEQDLKDLIRWDTEKYMNVWTVASLSRDVGNEGIVGNATVPYFHGSDTDGLIIEATFFGGTVVQNKVFTHETAHYLGLYHTFEGGCINDDCLNDGDLVCDTPPDGIVSPFGCEDGENSCASDENDLSENNPFRPVELGGLGDQPDMQENYMDYSPLTCYERFTLGQCERMVAMLLTARASLLEGNRCNPPCTIETTVNVSVAQNSILLGETLFFENNSIGFGGAMWYVNEEEAAGTEDFLFDPLEAGEYFIEVLLFNDEPGCNVELEFTIEVICPATAMFSSPGSNVLPDDQIDFDNESIFATGYEWYYDGELVSGEENVSITFDELGTHEVCLVATNGSCSTSHCESFNVGSCATSRENDNWYFYTGETSVNHYEFTDEGLIEETLYMDYAENKSTLSSPNGELMFSTNGQQLFDASFNVTPNGSELLGHVSARKGALFTPKPGSDHEYYLFTLDAEEVDMLNGLRYHVIDRNLNGGLGDIVPDMKNILISVPETETMAAIRHCNYEDLWLIVYNVADEQFESRLVSDQGVSASPVVYPFPAADFEVTTEYYLDIKVSPRGNMFAMGKHLFLFDNGTGETEHYLQYLNDDVTFYDFSPSGKYFYVQSQFLGTQIRLNQFDVTLPAEEIVSAAWFISQPFFSVYSDIMRTPGGEIYLAGVFAGTMDVIQYPDLYGDNMGLEYAMYDNTGFLNSFGNYYHAYTDEDVLLDGPAALCQGQSAEYSIAGCPDGGVSWTVSNGAQVVQTGSNAEITFSQPGVYNLEVAVSTACGQLTGSMVVAVYESIQPDLGPDVNVCAGSPITLTPGSGFASYEWSDGSTGESLEVSDPGVYGVEVTSSNGCLYSDEIEVVEVISGDIVLGPDFEICDTIVVLDAGDDFLDYVWQDGSTGQYYTVYEPGTYSVTATVPCEASDEVVVEDCHNSIGEYEQAGLVVYPNPASEEVLLILPENVGSARLRVFDASGRLVLSEFISNPYMLRLRELSPGYYSLEISHNNLIFREGLVVK